MHEKSAAARGKLTPGRSNSNRALLSLI